MEGKSPPLHAPKEAVPWNRKAAGQRTGKKAATYCNEIHKLLDAGYTPLLLMKAEDTSHSWFILHHMVHHNGKNIIVFKCSFMFEGQNLNDYLNIYHILAQQYEHLGFLIPYTTRAKVIVQCLWDKKKKKRMG